MTEPGVNTILFLSQNPEESKEAEKIFRSESEKSELSWTAVAQTVLEPQQLEIQPSLIVVLEHGDQPFALPSSKVPIEVWKIPAPSEVSSLIKQNISNLVVRLILKGGKRQPSAAPAVSAASNSNAAKAAAQAAVRVGLESKGRGGKKVSVISGLALNDTELDELTTKLKRTCGTGGTFKDGQIEIQGDHRDKLMAELQKLGYKPKRKGG